MEEKIRELVNHDIYAGNLILGRSLLFTLNLPPQWQLAPGVSRPEVNAISHPSENKQIVVNGNAWYVVFDGDRGWALEFAARIRPLSNHRATHSLEEAQGELMSVSNHPAAVDWKTKRRGLPWQRHDVTFMNVKFKCSQTQRQISLEFSGWCPHQGFEEILTSMRFLRCHYGMFLYDAERVFRRERADLEHLFVLISFGDLLGVPILPPYYSLRLLPFVVPLINRWRYRMLREKDLTDLVG